MAAAEEFPDVHQDQDTLHAAARWCLELADESRRLGRETMFDVATSRAALAFALAGIPERARPLVEHPLGAPHEIETEAAWNFGLAAHYSYDAALALRVLPSDGDEYMRVQRAMIAAHGRHGRRRGHSRARRAGALGRSADLQGRRRGADPRGIRPDDLAA